MADYDWRYENAITRKDVLPIDPAIPYNSYRTNRYLANFVDTVAQANQMNLNRHLDPELQYKFLFHSIRKKKRFFKNKSLVRENETAFDIVQSFYGLNNKKTHEALSVLSLEQIEIIRKRMDTGGVK